MECYGPSYDHKHVYITSQIGLLLEQSLQLDLHPGYFLTWGRPLGAMPSISLRYSSAIGLQLTNLSHCRTAQYE